MKKIIALLTALTMLLCAGCGAKGPAEKPDGAPTAPDITTEKPSAADQSADKTEGIQADHLAFQAEYPEGVPYPVEYDGDGDYEKWRASKEANRNYSAKKAEGVADFAADITREMLKQADGENRICSPLNIYMALAMLAEITDGDTRAQILDVLGTKNTDTLRRQAKELWEANYTDDGTCTSVLADSVWLSNSMKYKSDTLKTLAENYYASSFTGEMGSEDYNNALRNWLNEQTGGLLKDSVGGVGLDPSTVIALASTVYFNARWSDEFSAGMNTRETFHADGRDVECEFMHQEITSGYYSGKGFSAVNKNLINAEKMRLILPDEGVSVDELLCSDDFLTYLTRGAAGEDISYGRVELSVPKFDVTSDTDLQPVLENMGITDVFDYKSSDFSPLTDERDDLFVGSARHSARVLIDEEGCTAAAFTVFMAKATGMLPDEVIEFDLDRPFIFVIDGADGLPLFAGVVNDPA